jgi:mono/diheme cytochrome c family protein
LHCIPLITISEAIGRFHPVLVHLPIGVLLIAVLFHWLSDNPKYGVSAQVVKLLYGIGIGGALLSAITGFLLSNSGEYDESTVALHMWLGIFTTALSLLVFARLAQQKKDAKWLSLLLLLFLSLTGHFGGSLTHGADYLTAAWVKEKMVAVKPITNVQQAAVYADVVQPMLQSRCYNCHGAQKKKGGLRMDTEAYLLKGGKGGEIIRSGNAAESELIKRLLLPREHEDHMPPKQKPQLTEQQVALLHWWIEQGAPFDKKVAELQQPEAVKPILAALQRSATTPTLALTPKEKVPPADANAIKALQEKGVVVLPIDKESPWLALNFVTAHFTNADAALLLPLKKQLLVAKLNDMPIDDVTLNVLAQCTNIAVLQLNNTAITDKGVAKLQALSNLRSLSVTGTKVSAAGVAALRRLPHLQNLYLYQTAASGKEALKLKALFPKTALDTGGYTLATLAADTTEVQPAKQ